MIEQPEIQLGSKATSQTEGEIESKYIPPSFPKDQTIDVKFPLTEVVWTFKAAELQRGRIDQRWTYPSPVPSVQALATPMDRLDQYYNLLGVQEVIDIIEAHLSQLSQYKWKQAAKDSGGDLSKASELFQKYFSEMQIRDSASSEGLSRQAQRYMKLFAEEKAKNGLTLLAKEYHQLFKEYNSKSQQKILEDMQKMLGQ